MNVTRSNHALLGVVLCGGRSSRMGTDKSKLTRSSGLTFLQHAIERLDELCEQVCIAGRDTDQQPDDLPAEQTSCIYLPDPVAYQGPAIGIVQALDFAIAHQLAACLITPVDMPKLTAKHLQLVRDTWLHSPDEVTCVINEADGRTQPLVGIYPCTQVNGLRELSQSQNRSLTHWLSHTPHQTVTLPADACININSPSDLRDGS